MNIFISTFTMEAYDKAFALWQECEGMGLSSADSREGISSYLERNPGMSFIARVDGRLVGTILGGHDGRRGYIHHLAVQPDQRKQGIARRLVDRCLQALKEAGIRKCHIFIFNENENGIEFWKRIGWLYRSDISIISKFLETES